MVYNGVENPKCDANVFPIPPSFPYCSLHAAGLLLRLSGVLMLL